MEKQNTLRVLMISTDRDIFRDGTPVRERMKEYGTLVAELHILVFAKKSLGLKEQKIASNVWVYPTRSRSRWSYIFDARRAALSLFDVDPETTVFGFTLGVKEKQIDLVTTQDPFETGLAGYLISRKIKVPLHLQVHTDFLSPYFSSVSFLNRIRVILAKFLLPRAEAVRIVSKKVKEEISKRFGFSDGHFPKLDILPVFVDIEYFKNTPPRFDLREKFPNWNVVILVVSRFEKEKNVRLALSLLSKIKVTEVTRPGMVIMGDGSEKAGLETQVKRLRLEEQVAFVGWQSDLPSYYKTADCLLVTSWFEGYGRVFVESAASGCPVISFDVGAAGEVLGQWNSILCHAGDNACLERVFREFVEDRDLRGRLRDTAKKDAEKIFGDTKEEYLRKYFRQWESAALQDITQ